MCERLVFALTMYSLILLCDSSTGGDVSLEAPLSARVTHQPGQARGHAFHRVVASVHVIHVASGQDFDVEDTPG